MKKYRAFISLFIILILPLVVYVVLKLASTQHYRPIETLSEKVPNPSGGSDSVFKAISDFSLQTQTGSTLTLDSLKGKVWVVSLFYGNCLDACDLVFTNLAKLHKDYKDSDLVRFVSISVDPDRDSLGSLKATAAARAPEARNWTFARVPAEGLAKLLVEDLRYAEVPADAISGGLMPESSLRLLDWNALMRGEFYDGAVEDQVVRLSQHLKLLLGEYEDTKAAH